MNGYCAQCRSPLAPGATFCGNCGTPVAQQGPPPGYGIPAHPPAPAAPPPAAYPPARPPGYGGAPPAPPPGYGGAPPAQPPGYGGPPARQATALPRPAWPRPPAQPPATGCARFRTRTATATRTAAAGRGRRCSQDSRRLRCRRLRRDSAGSCRCGRLDRGAHRHRQLEQQQQRLIERRTLDAQRAEHVGIGGPLRRTDDRIRSALWSKIASDRTGSSQTATVTQLGDRLQGGVIDSLAAIYRAPDGSTITQILLVYASEAITDDKMTAVFLAAIQGARPGERVRRGNILNRNSAVVGKRIEISGMSPQHVYWSNRKLLTFVTSSPPHAVGFEANAPY